MKLEPLTELPMLDDLKYNKGALLALKGYYFFRCRSARVKPQQPRHVDRPYPGAAIQVALGRHKVCRLPTRIPP